MVWLYYGWCYGHHHGGKMTTITDSQFNAMHVWFRLCEKAMNDFGLYRIHVLSGKKSRWKENEFKYYIYKPFLLTTKGKTSTKDQDTCEPCDAFLALCAHFATDYGLTLPTWPNLRG